MRKAHLSLKIVAMCALLCASLFALSNDLDAATVAATPRKTAFQSIRCAFSSAFSKQAPEYCKAAGKGVGTDAAAVSLAIAPASPAESKPSVSKAIPPKVTSSKPKASLPVATTTTARTKGAASAAGITRSELDAALAGLKSEMASLVPKNAAISVQPPSYPAASGGYSVPPNNAVSTDYISAAIDTVPVPWTSSASALYYTGGNVGIGTSTPSSVFEVAGKTVAFNSGMDGSLGAFSTNSNALPVSLAQHSSVVANGYVYVLGGTTNDAAGGISATVRYAKINGDGSIGTWTSNANSLPQSRRQLAAVVANGYVYAIAGRDSGDSAVTTVYYAKLNSDGSTGAWSSTTALPSARRKISSVVSNGYVYVLGGADGGGNATDSVYYAKLNADGSIGSWTTSVNVLPSTLDSAASIGANGYIYAIGGVDTGNTNHNTVYYAKLNADGSTGSWSTNANNTPVTLQQGGLFVANGYVYYLAGLNRSGVYYAKLNADGSTGLWSTNTNTLPSTITSWASVASANGYVYVLGGGPSTAIYYASTARVLMSGTLDLLGLTIGSGGMTDSSGDTGSSIYAGNIYLANRLEVAGNAQLWNGLSVNGGVSIFAATSTATSTMIFSIAGTSTSLMTVFGNGNIGMGTANPQANLHIRGSNPGGNIDAFMMGNASVGILDTSITMFLSAGNDSARSAALRAINTTGASNGQSLAFLTSAAGATPSERMRITDTGTVLMGTTTSYSKLTVAQSANTNAGGVRFIGTDGDYRAIYISDTAGVLSFNGGDMGTINTATLNAAGAWTNASDRTYKENIVDLSGKYGLGTVLATSPRFYTMKGTGKPQIGFIAQELQPIVPEVVEGSEGSMGISYGNLIAVSFQAIKDLAHEISDFAKEVRTDLVSAIKGVFQRVETEEIETKTLCVEDVCVTKEQFKMMLERSGVPIVAPPAPVSTPMPVVDMNTVASSSAVVSEHEKTTETQISDPAQTLTLTPTPDLVSVTDPVSAPITETMSAPEQVVPVPSAPIPPVVQSDL